MPRFFVPSANFDGDTVRITGDDARHIARALRMAVGETVTVCDMHGTTHTCVLEKITDDGSTARIVESVPSDTEPPYPITLYQAFPKGDKMDVIVQKAVESGACAIVPFLSERCVSRPDEKSVEKKIARWQRIALEAAKQSGRGIIPEIGKMTDLESALRTAPGKKILFYEGGGEALGTLVTPDEAEVSVFIGPEGGFDAAEVQLAKQYGAAPATLGPRILRTETAPLAALSVLMYITENMQ